VPPDGVRAGGPGILAGMFRFGVTHSFTYGIGIPGATVTA
jgi:hypothetical protein